MADISPAWIALIGTVFGGVGLKLTEAWLSRSTKRDDTAHQLREELRTQVMDLRTEITRLQTEADLWQAKYYDLRDQFTTKQTELTLALNQIKEMVERAEKG
jgi:predicted  nucleic acid-binding Zn-ribbon protein